MRPLRVICGRKSDSTDSEAYLHFCIVENSKSVVKDEQQWARTTRMDNSTNVATDDRIVRSESIVGGAQNWARIDRTEHLQSAARDAVKIEDHDEWTVLKSLKNPGL